MRKPKYLVPTTCLLAVLAAMAGAVPPNSVPEEGVDTATDPAARLPLGDLEIRDPGPVAMTQGRLEELLRSVSSEHEGGDGALRFVFQGVLVVCVSDPVADRMRLLAPIIEMAKVTEEQRLAMLEANFHTALDARYAASDGVLYAAFIHPLSPLRPGELSSAVEQVANLVRTFGSSYTSGVFTYGGE